MSNEPNAPLVPRDRETVLPAKMAMMKTGGAMRALIPETMEDAARLARMIVAGGVQPRGYQNWEAVTIGILHGMEVGFSPMAALQSIAVINNVPTIYGSGIPAILYASGELEEDGLEEFFEGVPYEDDYKAVCIIRRKGYKPCRREFTVKRAKQAKLWNQNEKIRRFRKGGEGSFEVDNDSPWFRFPDRMLQMRARSWAANDRCADLLRGFRVREEVEDEVRAADAGTPMTARQEAVATAPPPPEEPPPAIAAPAQPAPTPAASEEPADVAEFVNDAPPPEDPPEVAPPARPKVEIDDATFIRNIEAELKNLAIGDPDLLAKFEAINTACEGRYETGTMFPGDIGALSDLVERYRKELDL